MATKNSLIIRIYRNARLKTHKQVEWDINVMRNLWIYEK